MTFSGTQGQVTVNSPIWPEIEHVQDFVAVLIICKYEEDPIKNEIASFRTFYPQEVRQLLVAVEFLSNLPQKLTLPFLHPVNDATYQLASEILKFESVDDDGWTADHWYTISSPCKPSVQMS